jgi:hypothetical protein
MEVVLDPLGEAQGSCTGGVPRGPSTGASASSDARFPDGAAEVSAWFPEVDATSSVVEVDVIEVVEVTEKLAACCDEGESPCRIEDSASSTVPTTASAGVLASSERVFATVSETVLRTVFVTAAAGVECTTAVTLRVTGVLC